MKKEITTKQEIMSVPTFRLFSKTAMFQDYKACPLCGQNEIPFKKGVCPKCCCQIGDIQYVRDPQQYVKSNYYTINVVNKNRLYTKEELDEK